MTWARCSACGEMFGSDSGFERHRVIDPDGADWHCATPAEMEARGLHRDGKGWWRQAPPSGLRVSARTAFQGQDGSLGQGAA